MITSFGRLLALVSVVTLAQGAAADEGMYTFDNVPAARIKAAYGFEPDAAWLARVRLGSIRLAGGCSASLISAQGLVLTNHHCARSCLDEMSSPAHDLNQTGFYARTAVEERRCASYEADQLIEITDVSAPILAAVKGLEGEAFANAEKAAESAVEGPCAVNDRVRCDVVKLYDGALYHLYKYRRFQDVRLVWAPEEAVAFFGGDPDNFTFPRYDLDASLLRIYQDGKPLQSDAYFPFATKPLAAGDLTFISGNPGGTSRLMTAAQLRFDRDVVLPWRLAFFSELRGMLSRLRTESADLNRVATAPLFGVENGLKAFKGRHKALVTGSLIADKEQAEAALSAPGEHADVRAEAAGAVKAIADAVATYRPVYLRDAALNGTARAAPKLFRRALMLYRYGQEVQKPDAERLAEFRDADLPDIRQQIEADDGGSDALSVAQLGFWLTRLREELGADDPATRAILGKAAPDDLARALVTGTRLRGPAARKALMARGPAAILASTDPLMVFISRAEPWMRAARLASENGYGAVVSKNATILTRARFALYGTGVPPDATFSPRLSYGQVQGYVADGKTIQPVTDFAGAFARATGHDPFALPKSWTEAEASLDLTTPLNFVTTNDIIGGNSGSPILNQKAELVGLVFDGNIESLGGDYGYDGSVNRAVGVSAIGLRYALGHIYHVERIVTELNP